MKKKIQQFLFETLSVENYLKLLQRSYFLSYNSGLLKLSKKYSLHYYVKRFIKEGDTVIDIGANLGYYSVSFSKWAGETGHVYSVEPIGLYNKLLKEKLKKRNNVVVYPYALGVEEKEVEMVNPLSNGYLSTGLPHVYDKNRDGNIDDIEYRFKVQMKRPSILFSDLKKINYIKCDVEGFEYIVLSEMQSLIDTFKPIVQVEVWNENDSLIRNMFKEMGYKLYFLNQAEQLEEIMDDAKKSSSDYIFIHP